MKLLINSLLSCKKCGTVIDKRRVKSIKLDGISADMWKCPSCKNANREWR